MRINGNIIKYGLNYLITLLFTGYATWNDAPLFEWSFSGDSLHEFEFLYFNTAFVNPPNPVQSINQTVYSRWYIDTLGISLHAAPSRRKTALKWLK